MNSLSVDANQIEAVTLARQGYHVLIFVLARVKSKHY